jgi:hypothetical protein
LTANEADSTYETEAAMIATLKVINQMQADGIIGKYAIGGAVGAVFHLEPIDTVDIDIFVALRNIVGSSLISIAPLYEYLTSRGYKTEGEYVLVEGWPVQFLPPDSPLTQEALDQAIDTTVEEVTTRVMTAEHLMALALKTGRAKDFARILQFVEAGVLETEKLNQILERHQLLEKWQKFGDKFLRNE